LLEKPGTQGPHPGQLLLFQLPEGGEILPAQRFRQRLVELRRRQDSPGAALQVENSDDALGPARLQGETPRRPLHREVIDVPAGSHQPEKALLKAQDAFGGAMGEIVQRKERMQLAPGAASIGPDARQRGGSVPPFLELNDHGVIMHD